jgi:hypothetical protein
MWEREEWVSSNASPTRRAKRAEFNPLCHLGPILTQPPSLTSANSLLPILRHLDEIERKLDRMMEELRTPTSIGYSVRRGNFPKKD